MIASCVALDIATDRPHEKHPHVLVRAIATAEIRASAPIVVPKATAFPRLDEVCGRSSHNSYMTGLRPHEGPYPFYPGTGTEERMLDQLLFDGVACVQLHVHPQAGGGFAVRDVYSDENSRFATLEDALASLLVFHRALPRHEVVEVVLALKSVWPMWPLRSARIFDEEHTMDSLDATIRRGLGAALCIAGSWSESASDWARYAGRDGGGITTRAAFPMRSICDADGGGQYGWPGGAHEDVPAETLERARASSIFRQLDDDAFPREKIPQRTIVRAFGEKRSARVQLPASDHPWAIEMPGEAMPGPIPVDPRRRYFGAASDDRALLEPGERIFLASNGPLFRHFSTSSAVSIETVLISPGTRP